MLVKFTVFLIKLQLIDVYVGPESDYIKWRNDNDYPFYEFTATNISTTQQ